MELLYTYQEILQDAFFIKFILDIKRNTPDKEAKNYLIEFIKDTAILILYELSVYFDEKKILSKSDFFVSNMNSVVRERRQWIKTPTYNSNHLHEKTKRMGIDFSNRIYDINIIINHNKLLSTSFENYDCKNDLCFVDDVLKLVEIIFNSGISALEINNKILESLFLQYQNAFNQIIDNCATAFSGKRYSYSTNKLFSFSQNLTTDDKIFILQRYRLVSSIFEVANLFANNSMVLQADPFRLSLENVIRKYKALIIDILGRDITTSKSDYIINLQNTIDQNICAPEFFSVNRKLRNNIHYSTVEEMSDSEICCLNNYQDIYLNIILNSFKENLYVNIEPEDIIMTNYLLRKTSLN